MADTQEEYWAQTHKDGYDDVYSVTEDQGLRDRILAELRGLPEGARILIQGCGSRGILERDLAERLEGAAEIVCNDFEDVVKIPAKANRDVSKITYVGMDSRGLGDEYPSEFDAVVVVNSVLSDKHKDNLEILDSCRKALRPGGKLVGFFPTVFCALDLAHSANKPELLEVIDLGANTVTDPIQNVEQVFYTPIRLRQVFREAGYALDSVEIYYLDSEHFLEEAARVYKLDNPETPIYEHLVLAHRPGPD